MKCTCPTRKFCVGTQRKLYSTGLHLDFASGKTQLIGFASGKNAKNWCHLTQKIPTCWYPQRKSLASGLLPNANPRRQNFASQWNIGFSISRSLTRGRALPMHMKTSPVRMMMVRASSLAAVNRSWMRVAQRTLRTFTYVRIAVKEKSDILLASFNVECTFPTGNLLDRVSY